MKSLMTLVPVLGVTWALAIGCDDNRPVTDLPAGGESGNVAGQGSAGEPADGAGGSEATAGGQPGALGGMPAAGGQDAAPQGGDGQGGDGQGGDATQGGAPAVGGVGGEGGG